MHVESDVQLSVTIDSVRTLRMARRAPEAQAMLREIAAQPDAGGVRAGQMGIDMNCLGMYAEAEARPSLSEVGRVPLSVHAVVSVHASVAEDASSATDRIRPRKCGRICIVFAASNDAYGLRNA